MFARLEKIFSDRRCVRQLSRAKGNWLELPAGKVTAGILSEVKKFRRSARTPWLSGIIWLDLVRVCVAASCLRRIVPLGICPNGTILYLIRRQLFGIDSSPMTVGMGGKSLEIQTPGVRTIPWTSLSDQSLA